jgi:hypothetical protein
MTELNVYLKFNSVVRFQVSVFKMWINKSAYNNLRMCGICLRVNQIFVINQLGYVKINNDDYMF